ncbi:MAG: YraN family protein [Candidatus Obscuribacterales bacterium]|nr:YraN family protein [Candidatus Obscuribacterales bacterium]
MPLYTKGKPPAGQLARLGEDIAANFYEKQGYRVLARNWRAGRFAEVDLILVGTDGLFVFVEVKTRYKQRAYDSCQNGLDAITYRKQQKIVTSARIYLARNGLGEVPCRFDAIAVAVDRSAVSEASLSNPEVIQVQSAF